MRNERISSTMRMCNLNTMIYHLVTRSEGRMAIYEENMSFIDLNHIKITKETNTTIHFTDRINEYSFNCSKNTLLKRFDTVESRKIFDFKVDILANPYDFLLSLKQKQIREMQSVTKYQKEKEYIILPLYSPRSKKVEARSGLNQWNAKGRVRHYDEVYIPIPSVIHEYNKRFFIYNTEDRKTENFNVKLPNGKIILMKVAQAGGKALMSNPNKDLGKWILRDILKLKPRQLVTKEMLDIIGIDSIILTKIDRNMYYLDFVKSGSYEEYIKKLIS